MTNLISHPFRLTMTGSVATTEQGSENHYAEMLAVLVLTKAGERDLVPEFGIEDPVFNTIDPKELAAKVAMFGPPVSLGQINVDFPKEGIQNVTVNFDFRPDEEDFVPDVNSSDVITAIN